jgi:hypothetical protein
MRSAAPCDCHTAGWESPGGVHIIDHPTRNSSSICARNPAADNGRAGCCCTRDATSSGCAGRDNASIAATTAARLGF